MSDDDVPFDSEPYWTANCGGCGCLLLLLPLLVFLTIAGC